ncbi:unnamed protein product, partial [Prorocentrum cordatum]|eukprot:7594725-Pyramimonas_sp.AAC.1
MAAGRRHLRDAISLTERLGRLAVWTPWCDNALCCRVWAANAFFVQSVFPAEVVQGRILQRVGAMELAEAVLQCRTGAAGVGK